MRHYADAISMMMQRKQMPFTGAYNTVESTTLIMDDPSTNIIDYR